MINFTSVPAKKRPGLQTGQNTVWKEARSNVPGMLAMAEREELYDTQYIPLCVRNVNDHLRAGAHELMLRALARHLPHVGKAPGAECVRILVVSFVQVGSRSRRGEKCSCWEVCPVRKGVAFEHFPRQSNYDVWRSETRLQYKIEGTDGQRMC